MARRLALALEPGVARRPGLCRVVSQSPRIDRLRNAGRTLAEWRDFAHPWERPDFNREREIDRMVGLVHQLAELTADPLSGRDNLFLDTDAASP